MGGRRSATRSRRRKPPAIPIPARPIIITGSPTLERIVAEKGLTDAAALARTRDAWERACERTPHGTPIELRPDDFRG